MKQFLVIFMIAVSGCSQQKGLPVLFIVPDSFKGAVYFSLDSTNGLAVPVTNGEYLVTIPADGKLTVRSFDFILGSHIVSAQYASGQPLRFGWNSTDIGFEPIDLDRHHRPPRSAVYLVGTQQDKDEAIKSITY
jgi:hypothetical protein